MTGCPVCFGPLFRRACLGSHGSTTSTTSAARVPRPRFDSTLSWRREFTTVKGAMLPVAVWRAYRVVGPHEVRIWAASGDRWPA